MESRQFGSGASPSGRPASLGSSSAPTPPGVDSDLVHGVVAVLAGSELPQIDHGRLEVFADLLRLHRLAGLGHAAAQTTAPAGALAHLLEPDYRRAQLAGAFVQETLERALGTLRAASIPALVFKGAALVRRGVYADAGERPMDDVDVLVAQSEAEKAVEVLCSAGLEPWTAWQPGREFWSDAFTLNDPAAPRTFPCHVDLHWRTEYGGLRFGQGGSALWSDADSENGDPAPEAHLLVIAEHFLKHLRVRPHLLAYADLVRLCGAVSSWEAFEGLARGRWWTAATGLLLDVLRDRFGAPVPEPTIERLIETRPAVRRARTLLEPEHHVGRGESGEGRLGGVGLRWQLGPGSAGIARDVWETLVPPGAWLRARYGGGSVARHRLVHGGAVLRWAFAGGISPLSPNQEPPHPLASTADSRGSQAVDTPEGHL